MADPGPRSAAAAASAAPPRPRRLLWRRTRAPRRGRHAGRALAAHRRLPRVWSSVALAARGAGQRGAGVALRPSLRAARRARDVPAQGTRRAGLLREGWRGGLMRRRSASALSGRREHTADTANSRQACRLRGRAQCWRLERRPGVDLDVSDVYGSIRLRRERGAPWRNLLRFSRPARPDADVVAALPRPGAARGGARTRQSQSQILKPS